MSLKVEKVGVEKVREKLLNMKRKAEKPLKKKLDLDKMILDKEEAFEGFEGLEELRGLMKIEFENKYKNLKK